MRAIALDAFVRNRAGQRDWGNSIMSPQTSQMMGHEQENLLKKYLTCSNTPGITARYTIHSAWWSNRAHVTRSACSKLALAGCPRQMKAVAPLVHRYHR
jgi:hypothetical protein